MKHRRSGIPCFAAALSTYVFLVAPAPVPAVTLEETVVTASRIEEEITHAPDSVTVITAEGMERKGQQTVIEALRDVPGIFIPQNGSFGSSSIYTRGTGNAHTLIMIDGVRVGDPMATDGKFSIADLSTDNIEKIEIVRGAQSVLYGSDAIGGVINIITKKGEGKPQFTLSSEAGSFESFREKIGVSGSTDRMNYAASVERFDTRGVSKADDDLPGVNEEDYYNNTSMSARVSGDLSDTISMGFTVRHNESELDYDTTDWMTGRATDADEVQETTITSMSTHFDQDLNDWWQHTIKLGMTDVEREYTTDGSFNNAYNGTSRQASWQHNFFIGSVDTVSAGFDYEEEEGDLQDPTWGNIPNKSTNTKSLFIQNKLTPVPGLSITLGYRAIDHQTFGSEDTYKGAIAYVFEETGTKLRGSYGTGFHAPSLYQLYSSYGSTSLKPEESTGYDIGIEQPFLNDRARVSLTYFNNEIDELIDFNMTKWTYCNLGEVRTEGWETTLSVAPASWVSINIAYTYTEATEETPGSPNKGNTLLYRPEHAGSASVNIRPLDGLNVNLNAQYTGKRYRDASNDNEMSAYTIINLAASYELTTWLEIFGRIENLTDKNYQSVYDYGEPGIGCFGGLNLTY